MLKTSVMAGLVAFSASGAMAQTADRIGDVKLDPGSSGGTAGLVSGGGTVSYNFDGRDARPAPETRAASSRAQPSSAKTGGDTKDQRMSEKAQTKAARARAEADNDESGKNNRVKKEKKPERYYSYPYVYPYGRGAFENRGFMRSRD